MIENNLKYTEVETLFKVEPPLTEVKDGFGFIGVILSEKTTGNIQCHICGGFYEHLSSHIYNFHKIKPRDYRIKYQLPLSYPLCNKSMSEMLRKRSELNGWAKHLQNQNGKKFKKIKHNNQASYARNNASFHNKHGLCELQMQKRYLLIADLVERDPTEKEIEMNDSKLLWAIKNRYKNINNFKEKFGYEKYEFRTKGTKLLKLKGSNDPYNVFSNLTLQEKEGIIKTYGSVRRAASFVGKEF